MKEKQQPRIGSPGPTSGGLFDDGGLFDGEATRMATVQHGAYVEQLPVANMTISEVRERFRDRLDIHPEARAVMGGRFVGDDTSVLAGEVVTFVRPAGAKGA